MLIVFTYTVGRIACIAFSKPNQEEYPFVMVPTLIFDVESIFDDSERLGHVKAANSPLDEKFQKSSLQPPPLVLI